ncbi:MAG: ribbon-helix-helix domain-containing protein [Clostridium sp.]|nr:ribbon-helix-helix domain-containing protein [Clostridium sp.]
MKELILEKRTKKEQNQYKTITIRVPREFIEKVDLLAEETRHSRNALVCKFIEYGLNHYEIR